MGWPLVLRRVSILLTVIQYELSYDKFQPNYKRLYHIASERRNSEGISYGEGVPYPAYDALKLEFPRVVTAAMFNNGNSQVAVLDPKDPDAISNKKFSEDIGIFFSDAQFFSAFQYNWLYGSPGF